jgi:hypothetical protein
LIQNSEISLAPVTVEYQGELTQIYPGESITRELPDDGDKDGITDEDDLCPDTSLGEVVNADGCSIAELCPCDNSWKNKGHYQKCVAHTTNDFVYAGLITEAQEDTIVSNAAESGCGHKK